MAKGKAKKAKKNDSTTTSPAASPQQDEIQRIAEELAALAEKIHAMQGAVNKLAINEQATRLAQAKVEAPTPPPVPEKKPKDKPEYGGDTLQEIFDQYPGLRPHLEEFPYSDPKEAITQAGKLLSAWEWKDINGKLKAGGWEDYIPTRKPRATNNVKIGPAADGKAKATKSDPSVAAALEAWAAKKAVEDEDSPKGKKKDKKKKKQDPELIPPF